MAILLNNHTCRELTMNYDKLFYAKSLVISQIEG